MSHEKEEGWWDEALPEAEDAPAAAWNAAAARGPAAVTIAGATGEDVDENVNGMFDRVPAERRAGGAPVYRRRGVGDRWLLLAFTNQWYVGDTENKDALTNTGWAHTVNVAVTGTLPNENLAGGWKVLGSAGWDSQPALTVLAAPTSADFQAAVVDVGILEVVRLEEVPPQIPLLEAAEEDSTMLRVSRESEQVAKELHVQLDFHDVVTHNAKEALLHHAEATLAQWIIMDWPKSRRESRLVRFPMSWWEVNAPCDLAIFKDRGADRFRRILVHAEPGPFDSLVVHVADCLARQEKGEIVLFRMVPESTPPEQMQAERDYHHQLRQLTRCETKSLILKTSDPNASLVEVSEKFDLLVLGAPPERPLYHLFFPSREHKLAEIAQCSALMLKTPRHRVHPRLELPQERGDAHFDLGPYLSGAAIGVRIRGNRKEDLFKGMAERQAEVVQIGSASSIEAALWERERRQSTALTGGVALLSATCASIDTTMLGVFTLEQSVDFRGGGGEPVDVCLVTVAPPAERQTQLWMLARLARMTLRPGFLSALRKSTNVRDLRESMRKADESIDRI